MLKKIQVIFISITKASLNTIFWRKFPFIHQIIPTESKAIWPIQIYFVLILDCNTMPWSSPVWWYLAEFTLLCMWKCLALATVFYSYIASSLYSFSILGQRWFYLSEVTMFGKLFFGNTTWWKATHNFSIQCENNFSAYTHSFLY